MLRNKSNRIIGITLFIAAVAWAGVFFPNSRELQVIFMDVGDGLCAIVRTPSGRTLVMDCGTSSRRDNTSVGRKLVAPYLQSLGLDSIDVAILSHPHSDHMSGFPSLFKLEPARLVLDSSTDKESPEHRVFLRAVRACHARYRIARRGQNLDMGDGVVVHILAPSKDSEYQDMNDNCIVARITYKRAAILLNADAGVDDEHNILDTKMNVRAQVLQVGHHGSRMATSPEWLSAVRPKIAVISCARHSHYGFPSKVVIDRLASCNARTYVTGQCGAVTITTDGTTIHAQDMRILP